MTEITVEFCEFNITVFKVELCDVFMSICCLIPAADSGLSEGRIADVCKRYFCIILSVKLR